MRATNRRASRSVSSVAGDVLSDDTTGTDAGCAGAAAPGVGSSARRGRPSRVTPRNTVGYELSTG